MAKNDLIKLLELYPNADWDFINLSSNPNNPFDDNKSLIINVNMNYFLSFGRMNL